jgi:hypothetical protein
MADPIAELSEVVTAVDSRETECRVSSLTPATVEGLTALLATAEGRSSIVNAVTAAMNRFSPASFELTQVTDPATSQPLRVP